MNDPYDREKGCGFYGNWKFVFLDQIFNCDKLSCESMFKISIENVEYVGRNQERALSCSIFVTVMVLSTLFRHGILVTSDY